MINFAATASLCAATLGLLLAALTVVVAAAPGLRDIRIFGLSCLLGALYAVCTAAMAVTSSDAIGVGAMRVGLMLTGAHTATWFVYRIRRERRSPSVLDRVVLGALVVVALLALVPGVYAASPWRHEVALVGVVYRDAHATVGASIAMSFFGVVVLWMFVRALVTQRAANPTDRAEVIGLGALLFTGAHDALVAMELIPTPYLLDLGYLALLIAMAFALTRYFVARSTALEERSRELAETQSELVARERLVALGEMSAVVAHEVRNPLGVIFNATASLKRRPGLEEERKLLEIVEEEAERLKRMVSDLLHFAQPGRLAEEDVPVFALVTSAASAARASVGAGPEDVVVEADGELVLRCDEGLLRQAIVNLVTNGLQASGRRSAVRVVVTTEVADCVITVQDDGAGVATEVAADVFRPFFTTRASGTGLGLSVVRKVAEAHRGTVELRETRGGGATFVVRLPGRVRYPEERAA